MEREEASMQLRTYLSRVGPACLAGLLTGVIHGALEAKGFYDFAFTVCAWFLLFLIMGHASAEGESAPKQPNKAKQPS